MGNSEAVINYRHRLKTALVKSFGSKCFLCKNKYINAVFDFHHIDPSSKSFGISRQNNTRSKELTAKEAGKCVMLCANCHRIVEHSGEKYYFVSNFNEDIFYKTINKLNGTYDRILKKNKKKREAKNRIGMKKESVCPQREKLKELIQKESFLSIGRMYNVSDNSVRKWCKKYNLPHKKSIIKNIPPEDWNVI